jgi:Uma2 family endonuclease
MIARIPCPETPYTIEQLSEANPGWKVEREADGSFTMSPTGNLSGIRGSELVLLLKQWVRAGAGGQVFDSSTGFRMPDGAILSPDASWMSADRWNAIPLAEREGYGRTVPDVCIEVASRTDSARDLIRKLQRLRGYGVAFALLIDPYTRTTWSDGQPPPNFPTDFTSVFDAGKS